MTLGTLVFDGRCGFCTRSVHALRRLDRHRRVRLIPLQDTNAEPTTGLRHDQLTESVWWLAADGSKVSGAAAVNAALSSALGTDLPSTVYRLPGMRGLQEAAYRWVAAHRHQLPGTVPWCEVHPGDCATGSSSTA